MEKKVIKSIVEFPEKTNKNKINNILTGIH